MPQCTGAHSFGEPESNQALILIDQPEPKPSAGLPLLSQKDGSMKRMLLHSALLLAAMTASGQPAFAQSARATPAFYIVLDTLAKRCSVVDKTPKTDTPNLTVANDTTRRGAPNFTNVRVL